MNFLNVEWILLLGLTWQVGKCHEVRSLSSTCTLFVAFFLITITRRRRSNGYGLRHGS